MPLVFLNVEVAPRGGKFHGFLVHSLPNILRNAHGAEFWPAHGAKMRRLGGFSGKRLVVVRARGDGVQG